MRFPNQTLSWISVDDRESISLFLSLSKGIILLPPVGRIGCYQGTQSVGYEGILVEHLPGYFFISPFKSIFSSNSARSMSELAGKTPYFLWWETPYSLFRFYDVHNQ